MTLPLRIHLLGEFQLIHGDTPITTVNTPRLQSLLAYLVLHRAAPQPRRQIAFNLWPDLPEARARANLRKLLYQLQQALPDSPVFLQVDHLTAHWPPDSPFTLDVARFEQAVAVADLCAARDRYTGDLLPDCYDDWIMPERVRLRQLYLETLEKLIGQLEADRDYAGALNEIQRLLQADPLREEVHRHLMRVQLLNGDRAAALHTYQNCVTVLQRELGVDPGPATRQVYDMIRADQQHSLEPPCPIGAVTLVGRAAEWARVQAAWQAAATGKPQLVLISGEAGIGKTRLAEELLGWVDRQGHSCAITHCYAAEGALAYTPLTNWLRQRPLDQLEPSWLWEVARLVPELIKPTANLAPAGPLTEPWQRQRFREALARAILGADLATAMPLLLLIEDVQWADGETLEWLHFVLRLNPRAKLLVAATRRTEMVRADGALDELATDLRRRNLLTAIDLTPLDRAATITLARQVVGRELDRSTADQIYAETEGVPLFVVEFMRAGLSLPVNVTSNGLAILPPMVQAAVTTRLAQLSDAARQTLEVAAVVGREFTFGVLAAVSGLAEDTLVQALDELWQRQIIREQGREAYNFSHDKLRQVVYAQLSGLRRRRLHRKVAETLAASEADRVERISGQIGWHFEQAGVDQAAAHWLLRAGEAAVQVGALAEAAGYFNRALALTAETDRAGRYRVLLAREKLYHVQAERDKQAHDLAELEELSMALNDPTLQATVAIERGHYCLEVSNFPLAVQLAQTALKIIEQARTPDLPVELARLEFEANYLWGAVFICQGQAVAARDQMKQALALARANGLLREQARALSYLGKIGACLPEARDYLEAALPLYRQIGDRAGECTCLQALGYALVYQYEYARVVACYEQSLSLARQIGFRSAEVDALYLLGYFHCYLGDWPAGRDYLMQTLDMARADFNHRRTAYTLFNLAVSNHGLAHDETALAQAREAIDLCQSIGDRNAETLAWVKISMILLNLERWPAAHAALQQALALAQRLDDPAVVVYLQARLAYVTLQLGRAQAAQQLIEEILQYIQRGGNLIGTDEGPASIYLYCFLVLHAFADPRAGALIDAAYAHLREQAAHVPTETWRRSFLENKRDNRRIVAAWQQLHDRLV